MSDKFLNGAGLGALRTWILEKLGLKQDTLVSGTNIKTINNESILGSGNITTPTQSDISALQAELDEKQDILVSGENIKTINNASILSGGNIAIPTAVSQLTNDSGFQTQTQVETLILDELSRFDHLDYEIVTTLPTTGSAGVRYLIKHPTDDRYEEWIYIGGQWYDIGPTDEVDLSDYYTKIETDTLLNNKIGISDAATDSVYGLVKLNSSESISLNANGQLDVGGRLGQMSTTTGVYSPKTINPAEVGNGSFLLTEASGTKLGNKSLAVSTGTNITLKSAAAAGSTQYIVANNYANRIICAGAVGGTVALNEASAATSYATVISVTINGSSYVPDSSANSSSDNIIITTDRSINPSSSISSIRLYSNEANGGFSNLFVGQAVGGKGGASVIVGQKVFSNSGNACALVGADLYNAGNGNAIFGRQHISKKNRWFMAGTGHDNSSGANECGVALGQWSVVSSDTAFAIGNGTNHTARSNLFEIKTNGDIYVNGVKLNIP